MGLKLKREDPAEDMRVLRFVLRDTQPPREAKATLAKWRTQQLEKRARLEPSQRNPIDAWPGDLLFFFRVILLLRGLCSALVCTFLSWPLHRPAALT
jgi:aarF domain-containing kinase